MARGILEEITRPSRAALGIVRRGVLEGLSANRIQDALTAGGLGIRRTTLLALIRELKGAEEAAGRLRFTRLDRLPDPSRLPEAITRLRRTYSFDVMLRGHNTLTGAEETRWVTVSLDELRSRRDIEDIASDFGEEYGRVEDFRLDRATLMGGRRAGALGVFAEQRG